MQQPAQRASHAAWILSAISSLLRGLEGVVCAAKAGIVANMSERDDGSTTAWVRTAVADNSLSRRRNAGRSL
jgi:hypothetical protein